MRQPKNKPENEYYNIVASIEEGKSMEKACGEHKVTKKDFYSYLRKLREDGSTTLLNHYAHAKEHQADAHAEEILSVCEDVRAGMLDSKAGKVILEGLKWSASKLKPKKYGDRIEQHLTGQVDVAHAIIDARQRLEKMKARSEDEGGVIDMAK